MEVRALIISVRSYTDKERLHNEERHGHHNFSSFFEQGNDLKDRWSRSGDIQQVNVMTRLRINAYLHKCIFSRSIFGLWAWF